MSCEAKSGDLVINKSIININFIKFSIHNIAISSKKLSSESGNLHRLSSVYNSIQSKSSKQKCQWILMRENNIDFVTGGRVIMIMDSYFGQKWWLKFHNDGFVYYNKQLFISQTLTDGMEWCGLLVDCFFFFLVSCLDTQSDGTHSLQMIHWWAMMSS